MRLTAGGRYRPLHARQRIRFPIEVGWPVSGCRLRSTEHSKYFSDGKILSSLSRKNWEETALHLHAENVSRLPYSGLSRPKVSAGLNILADLEVIIRTPAGRSSYPLRPQ